MCRHKWITSKKYVTTYQRQCHRVHVLHIQILEVQLSLIFLKLPFIASLRNTNIKNILRQDRLRTGTNAWPPETMLSSLIASTSRLSISGSELLRTTSCLQGVVSSPLLNGSDQNRPMLNQDQIVRFKYVPKKTLSTRFRGHIDLYNKEGKRDCLYAAVERYKRLDWGAFIGTKSSRYTKCWKRFDSTNWEKEQHGTMDHLNTLKLERMFTPDVKLPRYLPNDPYDKYNAMPFWKHRWTLIKNRKLIEKYGNKDHMFGRYKSHALLRGQPNMLPQHYYMPPDYLKTIATNPHRSYKPDLESAPPSNEPAPHFQRKKIRHGKKNREWNKLVQMRRQEKYLKEPLPLWSEAFNPTSHYR